MHKILLVSDHDYSKVSFIRQEVLALRSTGHHIRMLFGHSSKSDPPCGTLYAGFSDAPAITYAHYLWYFFLKAMTLLSPKYKGFIDAYADWPTVGRVTGAARALRWLRICGKVRAWKPGIVHVHFAWNLPHVIPLADFLDLPIVCTVHGSDVYLRDDWPNHLRNPIVRRIVCVSGSMKAYIEGRCPDLAQKTLRVFNPINETFLQDVAAPPDRMRIIMIAAFRTLKNHAWLLRSLRVLKDREIDFDCVLVGDAVPWEPEVFDEIRSMTERLGLSKSILFRGWLSAEAVLNEIDQSTVLALTSTSEGFGMVVVEALARQRAPVVTDLPGTRDATGGGEFGLLVPLNDDHALADALVKAHKETVGQTEKTRSGREFVMRNFHPRVHLTELQTIYEATLAE